MEDLPKVGARYMYRNPAMMPPVLKIIDACQEAEHPHAVFLFQSRWVIFAALLC
jgi:hypothetical protein